MEDVFNIEQTLIGEDVNGHEDDVEVCYRLQEGDVGDEHLRMRPALLPQVEEAGDEEGD